LDEITEVGTIFDFSTYCFCEIGGWKVDEFDSSLRHRFLRNVYIYPTKEAAKREIGSRPPSKSRRPSALPRFLAFALPVLAILGALVYFLRGRCQRLWAGK
jgi:hypothetical protein